MGPKLLVGAFGRWSGRRGEHRAELCSQ